MENKIISSGEFVLSKEERELREGKIPVLFRRFAIPGVVGLLFLGLQTIIDGIVLGNFVGANALASVSLILPCYSLIAALSIVIGVGCETLVSIRLGEQNRSGANDAMMSGLVFVVAMSVTFGAFIYTFAPQIVALLGANDVLIEGSVQYIRSLSPFLPFLSITFFCDNNLKAIGKPIYAMGIMTTTVALNIVLDIIFVTQFGMGISGAGLATGIAFLCGFLLAFPVLMLEKTKIQLFKGRFNWKLVARMVYNGSSEGVAELSSGINILIFNITMMKYLGEIGVAAFTALEYTLFVFITIFLGISNGIIPIVSYNFGANNWDRIKRVLRLAMKTILTIAVIVFLVLSLFGESVVSLFFTTSDMQVINIAAKGTSIYAFAFLFSGLNILASSYFTAIANAKISVVISSLRGLIFLAPAVILLPMIIGIEGIWIAIPLAEAATFVVSVILVRRSLRSRVG